MEARETRSPAEMSTRESTAQSVSRVIATALLGLGLYQSLALSGGYQDGLSILNHLPALHGLFGFLVSAPAAAAGIGLFWWANELSYEIEPDDED